MFSWCRCLCVPLLFLQDPTSSGSLVSGRVAWPLLMAGLGWPLLGGQLTTGLGAVAPLRVSALLESAPVPWCPLPGPPAGVGRGAERSPRGRACPHHCLGALPFSVAYVSHPGGQPRVTEEPSQPWMPPQWWHQVVQLTLDFSVWNTLLSPRADPSGPA